MLSAWLGMAEQLRLSSLQIIKYEYDSLECSVM